jgi:hypothetical protein
MAAPFGGRGNLDLGSLLNNLGGGAAGATELTLTAALVSGIFLGTVFLPGAAMIAISRPYNSYWSGLPLYCSGIL